MNLFAKAKEQAPQASSSAKPNKSTIFVPSDPEVRKAIDDFAAAVDAMKVAEAKKATHSGIAMPAIFDEFIQRWAKDGVMPENVKAKGNAVTIAFIVQDRGGLYNVGPEQEALLRKILGNAVDDMISETTTYTINQDILNKPGVVEALSEAITTLVTKNILTQAECDSLLKADTKRTIKKGMLPRIHTICGGVVETMRQVSDVLGTTITRYLKA
jgi:hypothetical protein